MQRVACKTLCYDARVIDPEAMAQVAGELDAAVTDAARRLLDAEYDPEWPQATKQQLRVPIGYGGAALESAVMQSKICRIAALAQILPTVRRHLRRILPRAAEEAVLSAIPLQGAEAAMQEIAEKWGIRISAAGVVAKEKEPLLDMTKDFQALPGLPISA